MANLNPNYEPSDRKNAVANQRDGRLVVIAGPGTGKTTSFLEAIKSLIDEGVPGGQICYLTFMRAITTEFASDVEKSEITKELDEAQSVWKLTAHSLAWKIILALGDSAEIADNLEILGFDKNNPEKAEYDFCKIILKDISDDLATKGIAMSVSKLWQELDLWRSLRQKNINSLDSLSQVKQDVINCIQEHFTALRLLDWDMVIPIALDVFDRAGLPTWLAAIKYFLVDEYQDFNPSEAAFISRLESNSSAIVIVGDDDQSLFSGRSAAPATLRAYLADTNSETVNFTICYRCPVLIVNAANHYLRVIHGVNVHDRLMSAKQDAIQGSLEFKRYKSAIAECDALANLIITEWIPQLQELENPKARDQIIGLFPSKKVLKQYKTELEKRGVVCVCREEDSDKDLFCLRNLLLLAYYRGHPLYDRFLLAQFNPLSNKYRALIWGRVKDGCSIPNAVQQLIDEKALKPKPLNQAKEFIEIHQALTSADVARIKPALNVDVDPADIEQLLNCANRADADAIVFGIIEKATNGANETESDEQVVPVRLMTMHSCKGLTKRFVFIPGCEDIWTQGNATGERLAEKMRLLYVAITRSKEKVIITFPTSRAKGDSLNLQQDGCLVCNVIPRLFGITATQVI